MCLITWPCKVKKKKKCKSFFLIYNTYDFLKLYVLQWWSLEFELELPHHGCALLCTNKVAMYCTSVSVQIHNTQRLYVVTGSALSHGAITFTLSDTHSHTWSTEDLWNKMFKVWFILENMGLWVQVDICPTVKKIPSKHSWDIRWRMGTMWDHFDLWPPNSSLGPIGYLCLS